MQFLEPWYVPRDLTVLDAQLASELSPGHALFGIPVRALARRQDRDDVLFELLDSSSRVAVVHLTHSVNVSPAWPSTEFFPNLSAWQSERMAPDVAEFNA